jgi:MoaA/NifB/PqqE/SkfB family radical SAM enzyme
MAQIASHASRLTDWAARIRRFTRLSPRQRGQVLLNRFERTRGRTILRSGPRMLDLVPTYRCNLRCVGCVHYQREGPRDLELGAFKKILEESAPWVVQYRLCSLGEPFMNKDVPEMLALIAERGIGTNVMTNGMLLTPELADFLMGRAKLDLLTFSIDGATAGTCERLRRGLVFDDLLKAVASATDAKRRHGATTVIQANTIAMMDNIEELPDLVRLARRVGIEDINVNYLTVEGETDLSNSLFEHPDIQKRVFGEARRVAEDLGVVLHLPPDVTDGSFRSRCVLPWDTLIIDTDGAARMCYYSWEEAVGNVWSDGGIRSVWNNAIYQAVRGTVESDCPFYRYCAHCSHRLGFSRIEAHVGKNPENAHLFAFDWDRPGAPRRPSGQALASPPTTDAPDTPGGGADQPGGAP